MKYNNNNNSGHRKESISLGFESPGIEPIRYIFLRLIRIDGGIFKSIQGSTIVRIKSSLSNSEELSSTSGHTYIESSSFENFHPVRIETRADICILHKHALLFEIAT